MDLVRNNIKFKDSKINCNLSLLTKDTTIILNFSESFSLRYNTKIIKYLVKYFIYIKTINIF